MKAMKSYEMQKKYKFYYESNFKNEIFVEFLELFCRRFFIYFQERQLRESLLQAIQGVRKLPADIL